MAAEVAAGMATLGATMRDGRRRLTSLSDDPATEVRLLARWVFGLSPLELVTRADNPVDPDRAAQFSAALDRRAKGEPVYRIIGARDFFGLRLALSPDTLEPRPDTEALVELVLDWARARGRADESLAILDLGTGTGAIALALLSQLPLARAVITDVSAGAIRAALDNARANGLDYRVTAAVGSWFNPVDGRFDVIVSNPPYIPTAVVPTLDTEVRDHDPLAALDGGADGLDPYRAIAEGAAAHLTAGGIIAVEIGFDQAEDVTAIFAASGFTRLELRKDLGGRDRALAFALRSDLGSNSP